MELNIEIQSEIKKNNGILSTKRVEELGFSRTILNIYVKEGLLERCQHGLYCDPELIPDEACYLTLRSKNIVLSHFTALYFFNLTNRTPHFYMITIPSNTRPSKEVKRKCMCFYIKKELFEIGLTTIIDNFGNEIRCYNPERSICDILRSRNREDGESIVTSIRNYAEYEKKNINQLYEYAKIFKVTNEVQKYMEVLL